MFGWCWFISNTKRFPIRWWESSQTKNIWRYRSKYSDDLFFFSLIRIRRCFIYLFSVVSFCCLFNRHFVVWTMFSARIIHTHTHRHPYQKPNGSFSLFYFWEVYSSSLCKWLAKLELKCQTPLLYESVL